MGTFIYINGRPDHQKGHHDDLIMSLSMCTYIAESSFSSVSKVTQHTKAMLESWQVSTNNKKHSDFLIRISRIINKPIISLQK